MNIKKWRGSAEPVCFLLSMDEVSVCLERPFQLSRIGPKDKRGGELRSLNSRKEALLSS